MRDGCSFVVSIVAASVACGSASNGSAASYEGVVTLFDLPGVGLLNEGETGTLQLDVADQQTVTGTFMRGSQRIAAQGTLDPATHALQVNAGGYSFTGGLDGGVLSGSVATPTCASPGPLPVCSGSFFVAAVRGDVVGSFCGTFSGTDGYGAPIHGPFDLITTRDGKAHVIYVGESFGPPSAHPYIFTSQLSATVDGGTLVATAFATGEGIDSASGAFDGGSVSGSYRVTAVRVGAGGAGTFAATMAACPH